MKKINTLIKLDYLFIVCIWLLIFGKNAFSSLMFVDYTPATYFNLFNRLLLSNFTHVVNIFDLLLFLFSLINATSLLFTLSILFSMLVSYYYIKRLFLEKGNFFYLLFAFVFMFNPFIYSRIMVGQIGVIISYLLMPVFLFYLFNFFKSDLKINSLIKLIISMTLVSTFSIHFFMLNFIMFLAASFWFYFLGKNKGFKKYFFLFAVLILFLVFLNSYWLFGIFSNNIFSSINSEDENFFSPKMSNDSPAIMKIIGMWGFWREAGYITTYRSLPNLVWYLVFLFMVLLLLIGYYSSKDKESKFFYTLFWIGLILGVGISHPYTRPVFDFLFKYFPFFNGFRDSHKLVSLIALSYSYFIPIAIVSIRNIKKFYKSIIVLILIIFILIYTYPLIFLWNQAKPVDYPDSYSNVNKFMSDQKPEGYIIYLPWQSYLTYSWSINSSSDGRINVPINNIIKKPVIIGPDKWSSASLITDSISMCLNKESIECLGNQSVQLILYDKCAYYDNKYEWINETKIYSTECLDIYKINNKHQIKNEIPFRFIAGIALSFTTLFLLLLILYMSRELKQTNK